LRGARGFFPPAAVAESGVTSSMERASSIIGAARSRRAGAGARPGGREAPANW
jgi:hypothetical protein